MDDAKAPQGQDICLKNMDNILQCNVFFMPGTMRRAIPGPGGIVALGYALRYGRDMQNLISTPKKYSELPTAEKMAVIKAWLEEHKAVDVAEIDLAGQGAFTDALLVVSATSVRHAQSLADGVSALCHEQNFEYLRMEGYNTGQWILVDCNDIVVNIFQQSVRDLYQLENLWGAAAAALNKEPRA